MLAILVVAALPVLATIETNRAANAIDDLLDEGVSALGELDDLMQSLLDIRSGVLEIALPAVEDRHDLVRTVEQTIHRLRQDAASLEELDVEVLSGTRRAEEVATSVAAAADAVSEFFGTACDSEVDPQTLAREALRVSALVDDAATAIQSLSRRIGNVARLVDRDVPRHLRIAHYAGLALAAIALAGLGLVLVERLKSPASRRQLKRLLAASLRAGTLRDPTGHPLCPATDEQGRSVHLPVRITRLLHHRPLHQTFMAEIHLPSGKLPVWGKRYTFLGALRSLVIPLVPMYARGSWRILCAFDQRGVTSPSPVALCTQRVLGIPVGHVVLARHAGRLLTVKRRLFGAKAFHVLDPSARSECLERFRTFVDGMHEAGCYQIKLRYVHLRAHSDGSFDPASPTFVLCDLDKVLHLPRAPQYFRNWLARHDRRRIARSMTGDLGQSETAAFRAWAGIRA